MSEPEVIQPAEFTIQRQSREDGCIAPSIEDVVTHAIKIVGVYSARRGFPAFTVTVDEGRFETNRVDSLRKFLSSISVGAKCRVFRNYGQGASIMFHP